MDSHFGFEKVTPQEKTKRVEEVFKSVAERYDLMNNLMSFGIHHLWKKLTIELSGVRPGQTILDLAGGSGDLTRLLAKKVGQKGHVILADINAAMLTVGRDRLIDEGLCNQITYLQANAEALPLEERSVDAIFIAFGLRNVTDQMKALVSMYRTCKPGGRLFVLEFTNPSHPVVKQLYDWYSFQVLPRMGKWVANDDASYRYLAESIRMHPSPEKLKSMIEASGFEDCRYKLLSAGVVALHTAYKY
jgi:demethylmenaquinone methyltransferase / 2-methoxy-6-polyprenyl-1,4-benzoquinol methylase